MLRYVILSSITLGVIVLIHAAAFTMLKLAESQGNSAAQENTKRIAQYNEVKKTATEYATNLKIAKSLFDKQIPYTTAILNLASVVPNNVILQDVNLSPDIIGKPSTLAARAKSYADGIALRDSLSSSKMAENVSLISLLDERDPSGQEASDNKVQQYPFSVSISLTFTKKMTQDNKTRDAQ